jgi:hypothetical protein
MVAITEVRYGSITCTFNVAAGFIADTLMIEESLKGEVVLFIEKKDGTIVIAGSQLGRFSHHSRPWGTIGDLNGFTVTFMEVGLLVSTQWT